MEIHHCKHHATYVANYNKAAEGLLDALEKGDVEKVTSAQSAIKFNGGGMSRKSRRIYSLRMHGWCVCS